MVEGVHLLHKEGIAHLDLKPLNVVRAHITSYYISLLIGVITEHCN